MGGGWSNQHDDDYSEDDSFSEEEEEESYIEEPPVINSTNAAYQLHDDIMDNICLDSATDTVDAVSGTTVSIILTLDQVMIIEKELDMYEKVSLVYLLYDDPVSALASSTKLVNGTDEKLIHNWALHQNSNNSKWHEKLVEAICIIQNYHVLRILGYNRDDLIVRFSPHHSFTFVNVNKFRKALYFLCDDFGQNEVTNLLSMICSDFQSKGLNFKVYNPQYLEVYLLYWETVGYIKQNNLSNLCSILKQMDQLDLCEKLKQFVPATSTSVKKITETAKTLDGKKSKSLISEILDPSSSLEKLITLETNNSADAAQSSVEKYYVDPNNPGVCLIINQETFYRAVEKHLQNLLPPVENKLESRLGTEHDKEKLVGTFQQFGFRVEIADNLDHTEIPKKIKEIMNSIKDESSFVVCIMSHGDEGLIYGVNSCRVSVKKIKNLMCSVNRRHLSGKPKVLILQSCQGTRCQKVSSSDADDDLVTDGPSSPTEIIPPCADLFTFWATVPGYGAIRNKKTGSWFIQSLCDKMKTLCDMSHFEDICTSVIQDVSSKIWNQKKVDVAMVPLKDSTFRKKFYLPPIKI